MNRNRRPKSRRFRQKHFLSCIIILRYGFFLLGRRRVSSALIAAVTTALVTAALAAVPAFIAAVRIVASAIAPLRQAEFPDPLHQAVLSDPEAAAFRQD